MNINSNDSMILSEMNSAESFRPSVQVERALQEIRDEYQTPMIAKLPFAEIASLGGAFSGIVETLATPVEEGIYRCVFPKGVTGTLAMAKDGSGALGTIMNDGIVGQARWIPVDKAIGPACLKATLVAVAILAVVKQINDIKEGQRKIIGILERDKKSQLLADYDLLSSYMDDYRFYWENETSVVVNLNQVKNIKRNAMKDIKSYSEQLEGYVAEKKNLLKMQSATSKIGKILDRFVHYKLALHVFALSEYMEIMLSKNFQAEYLSKISDELRTCSADFLTLYTKCYDKIEALRTEALTTQTAGKVAELSRGVGNLIGKIPVVKNGPVDEFLVGLGDLIDESEETRLKKTLEFFMQYKKSGIVPVAEHIETISKLANRPVIMLYDKNVLCFHELKDAM